jgi:hypothetical protein
MRDGKTLSQCLVETMNVEVRRAAVLGATKIVE